MSENDLLTSAEPAKAPDLAAGLTAKQARAVAALLNYPTFQQAATACGIADKTLQRWLDLPTFRLALRKAQGNAIDAAARRLAGGMSEALDVLATIMRDEDTPAPVRLRAALGWIESLHLVELAELERRVLAMETALDGKPT